MQLNAERCFRLTGGEHDRHNKLLYYKTSVIHVLNIDCTKKQLTQPWSFPLTFHIARHSQSNFRKSNSIEFNRTQSMDWVRLIPAIERNRTPNFVWVRFTNQSNLIVQIEPNRTQSIGLCSIEFSYRTQSNTVQWIAFDCVRWINWLGQRSCYVVWLPAWLL